MGKFFSSIKKRLNSWDEISIDETMRLRMNLLLLVFIITCMCIATATLIIIYYSIIDSLPTIAIVLTCIWLFLRQLLNPAYSLSTAIVFGGMGYAMVIFLIWTGGIEGTGFMWLYLIPVIAAMGLPLRYIIIDNCILMTIVLILMFTPLRDFMSWEYPFAYQIGISISLLFVMICSYMTEVARHNTHEKLTVASKKLQNIALTDPLTQVYNRRALETHYGSMKEKHFGIAFAMMDLDFFKKINDSYGHDIGDKTLSHVVKLTRESIPSDASVYRWGGEEFLLVLKTSIPEEFAKTLENLREKIEKNPLVFAEGLHTTIKITVSIGGVYPDEELTIGECIRLADMYLYKAKEQGRNRVVAK